jgi:hypothetical protein
MVPPAKLLNYIRQQLKTGYSAAVIKQSALAAGWNAQDVDAAIATAQAEMPKPVSPLKPFADLLRKPTEAINQAKSKNWKITGMVMVTSLIIFTIAAAISINSIPGVGGILGTLGIDITSIAIAVPATIALIAVWMVVTSLLLKTVIGLMGGKGGFYEAFTAVSYGIYVPAIGFLVSAALTLVPASTFVGLIGTISALVVMIALTIGIGTAIRALVDLFSVELLVVLTALAVVAIVMFMMPGATPAVA